MSYHSSFQKHPKSVPSMYSKYASSISSYVKHPTFFRKVNNTLNEINKYAQPILSAGLLLNPELAFAKTILTGANSIAGYGARIEKAVRVAGEQNKKQKGNRIEYNGGR